MDATASPPRGFDQLPRELEQKLLSLLSPLSLARAACVCARWRDVAAACRWDLLYSQLWAPTPADPVAAADAQRRYGERQLLSRAWLGRPASDKLSGHMGAVKAATIVQPAGILLTGGIDRYVRAWDLESGAQLAASRRHGGTVRCLAADDRLLASGSSDHGIRVWRRVDGRSDGGGRGSGDGGALFDLAGPRTVLASHAGPVSSLQLSPELLVSGSWDCTIRLWDRTSLQCIGLVHTDDWVTSLSLQAGVLAASCGREVLLFSLEGGALRRTASLAFPSLGAGGGEGADQNSTAASITAVALTADGRSVFMGAADGGVWLAHVPSPNSSGGSQRPTLLVQQPAEVASLSWDHPWLAVADRAGNVLLLDAGSRTPAGAASVEGATGGGAGKAGRGSRRVQQLTSRLLFSASVGGAGAAAQCVCLSGSWAAAGLDCGTAVSFDASRGMQQLAAATAAKQHKAARRQQRQERRQQQQQKQRGSLGAADAGASGSRGSQAAVAGEAHAASPTPAPEQQQHPAAQEVGVEQERAERTDAPGRPHSARARVPPPLHPDALAAAPSSCRQQAWQVMRVARQAPGSSSSAPGP